MRAYRKPARRWVLDVERPHVELAEGPRPRGLPGPLARADEHWAGFYFRRDRCHSELLSYQTGRRSKKRKTSPVTLRRARLRAELAHEVARLCRWLARHVDVRSRFVGKPDSAGALVPYSLEEIAQAMRRPGEQAMPLSTLCRVLRRTLAAGYIYRHQGRDLEVDSEGVEYWKGKVATLRLTHKFFNVSGGAAQMRERWLEKADKKEARRRAVDPAVRDVVGQLGRAAGDDAEMLEHFRRQLAAEGVTRWIDREQQAEARLEEWRRRKAEARAARGRPPPK